MFKNSSSDKACQSMVEQRSQSAKIAVLAAIFLIIFTMSFSFGRYGVPFYRVPQILLAQVLQVFGLGDIAADLPTELRIVVLNIRMPRIIAATLIGSALSVAGSVYQGLFKNALVSPDILGSSAGAAFGAALGIILGIGFWGSTALGFLFGILAVFIAYTIGIRFSKSASLGLVLSGIMVGSIFSAGISLLKLIADPQDELPAITYWLMGSLSNIRWQHMLMLALFVVIPMIPLFLLRWRLNVIALGDSEARALGVNTKVISVIVIACASLMGAACVAISGMITWVGLVVPHIARGISSNDYKYQLPASALIGASFMIVIDTISRTALSSEIPIGVLTAFVGAPFFLYTIVKSK